MTATPSDKAPVVDFDTHPSRYRHWRLEVEGPVARLVLDVDEQGGLAPGYELKQNSYDLGVDIELYDAVQRLRFEHPQVRAVVVTGGKERMFCAGANIRMLAASSHPWKVNFCKFTNETRNGIEDASAHSGQTWIAALNGPAAGGGYEIALACDQIVLVDDGSSAVSLPEVPLLGVLPGTGGLTRVVDKRHVRRDLADVFATRTEGVRGRKAVEWGLVDASVPPRRFDAEIGSRVAEVLATVGDDPRAGAQGIELTPLRRTVERDMIGYEHVTCAFDRSTGSAAITVRGPGAVPAEAAEAHAQGAGFWPLAMTRELDDLILRLRTAEPEIGTWVFRTEGDPAMVARFDEFVLAHRDDWLVEETLHYYKRTLKRLDVSSRTLFAVIEPGGCWTGLLAELALAADRSYLLDGLREEDEEAGLAPATLTLTSMNLGPLPMGNGLTRLASRFYGHDDALEAAGKLAGTPLTARAAEEAGLVTFIPDDLDWDEELRLALEERAAFSPDALTGMEASHRFAGPETLETKIFARLSAWQNWIFQRPNAAGPEGALRRYGSGQRPVFDRKRV
ncbi:2,3-epoxybenzoyl-CoA dihydrolase [Actinomadura sp. HBU206391]|uniref:2,3-epoxybenzoyl-CoA dihydrolase n=1 Tax=Actinomadura sp. HBU206391 TaxID=2731692 RepID=UPI00164F4058|nr:2,3-epoxybenzoyl-CoA dihydrolase [Actinomadura sp. HBU206391]MBC6461001.1 benzoyl-CoA-dihydrodiol lyase [Actinomadura sp. HBU206391]